MKPVVFENETGTQKIIVLISTTGGDKVADNDEINVEVKFEPTYGEQDKESLHYMAASNFISILKQ